MPRIPTSGGPQVAPGGTPQLRAPSEAFGVQAPPDLRGVQQAVQQVDEHQQRVQEEQDQIVLNNAEVQIGNLRTELMTKATSAQGHTALGAAEQVGPAWEEGVNAILTKLPNDRTKFLAQHRAAGYWANLNNAVQSHAAAQVRRQDETDTDALVQQDAQLVDADPTEAPQVAERVTARLTDFARRAGWSDVERDVKIKSAVSTIHANAITRWVEDGTEESALIAQNYLDIYRNELVGKQRTTAERLVEEGIGQGTGDREAARILAVPDDQTAEQEQAGAEGRAIAEGERMPPGKARDRALSVIRAHFNDLDRTTRREREAAQEQVTRQIEQTGGVINRASKAWQLIDGTQQGREALHFAEQTRHPPKDPGDPDLFLEQMNMASLSPASQQVFLAQNILALPGLNPSQRGQLIALQRQQRGQVARASEADLREAAAKDRQMMTADLTRAKAQFTDANELREEEQRIRRTYQSRAMDRAGTTSTPPAGTDPGGDVDLGALSGFLTPATVPTRQMIEDIARKGPGYLKYLTDLGYAIPANTPTKPPEPEKK